LGSSQGAYYRTIAAKQQGNGAGAGEKGGGYGYILMQFQGEKVVRGEEQQE
jgi:hypothetical protein